MNRCFALCLALIFLAGGCALNPQTVAIAPLVDARSQAIGNNRTLALQVQDRRPRQPFGARGGVYDTALINPRTEVAQAVYQALEERLVASGFRVSKAVGSEPLALSVEILRIDYLSEPGTALGSPLVNQIRLHAAIAATARNGARILNSQYQASSTKRQIGYPSAAENERLINAVLAETLRQLLHDPDVLQVLTVLP